jgi:hypothetical protein
LLRNSGGIISIFGPPGAAGLVMAVRW